MLPIFSKIFGYIGQFYAFRVMWNALVAFVSLFVPLGKRVFYSRSLWWVIHLALIGACLYGLYRLQDVLVNQYGMPNPIATIWPALGDYWLVILGLTLYAIAWILWWIWKLLVDDVPSYHPDIDAAWEQAKTTLYQAGIDLRNRPLFLILGRPESGERNLLEAAELKLEVKPSPADPRAPLRVFADSASIYVTCVGVSLLGRLAGILALEEMGQGEGVEVDGKAADDGSKTIVPSRGHREIVEDLE